MSTPDELPPHAANTNADSANAAARLAIRTAGGPGIVTRLLTVDRRGEGTERTLPESGWTLGYPVAIMVMVVAVVVLRWHFRRIGWL